MSNNGEEQSSPHKKMKATSYLTQASTNNTDKGQHLDFKGQSLNIIEVLAKVFDTGAHRLLRFAKPHARVVFLLVGFVISFRVADCLLQVCLELLVVAEDSCPVCPLVVCVHVDFLHNVWQTERCKSTNIDAGRPRG
jgi:hypothetical protein